MTVWSGVLGMSYHSYDDEELCVLSSSNRTAVVADVDDDDADESRW